MCGVQLKDRKIAGDLMLMLILNETIKTWNNQDGKERRLV